MAFVVHFSPFDGRRVSSPNPKKKPLPGVKFGPFPGVTSFTLAYVGKTLEISLYLAIRSRLTKFCM